MDAPPPAIRAGKRFLLPLHDEALKFPLTGPATVLIDGHPLLPRKSIGLPKADSREAIPALTAILREKITPEMQATIDEAIAGIKAGDIDPCATFEGAQFPDGAFCSPVE